MNQENTFIRHCNLIELQYGIVIPQTIQSYFAKFSDESTNIYYQALKNANDFKIFYTKEFVEFTIVQYTAIHNDFEILQSILNEGNYEYSLLEKQFISDSIDISFLNQCCNKFETIPFYIGIYTFESCGGEEFLIINGDKKGYIVARSHDDTEKIKVGNTLIKYQKIDFIKKLLLE
ncbi:uncharacterized protein CHSO_1483 [Chryseobacterium sp. StRB126]|uniref:hypothetical protein n=1 Tax=Chryseobacterium sp. StRB126 TaxID=878220 RepID=UPI0004E98F14|nr:hypothetical protein [Chryseobacterium sp. StRB126]BAP30520.1 uncharacterized protein CHSO_1483 [Chryseobacterium sp. StRB126]